MPEDSAGYETAIETEVENPTWCSLYIKPFLMPISTALMVGSGILLVESMNRGWDYGVLAAQLLVLVTVPLALFATGHFLWRSIHAE